MELKKFSFGNSICVVLLSVGLVACGSDGMDVSTEEFGDFVLELPEEIRDLDDELEDRLVPVLSFVDPDGVTPMHFPPLKVAVNSEEFMANSGAIDAIGMIFNSSSGDQEAINLLVRWFDNETVGDGEFVFEGMLENQITSASGVEVGAVDLNGEIAKARYEFNSAFFENDGNTDRDPISIIEGSEIYPNFDRDRPRAIDEFQLGTDDDDGMDPFVISAVADDAYVDESLVDNLGVSLDRRQDRIDTPPTPDDCSIYEGSINNDLNILPTKIDLGNLIIEVSSVFDDSWVCVRVDISETDANGDVGLIDLNARTDLQMTYTWGDGIADTTEGEFENIVINNEINQFSSAYVGTNFQRVLMLRDDQPDIIMLGARLDALSLSSPPNQNELSDGILNSRIAVYEGNSSDPISSDPIEIPFILRSVDQEFLTGLTKSIVANNANNGDIVAPDPSNPVFTIDECAEVEFSLSPPAENAVWVVTAGQNDMEFDRRPSNTQDDDPVDRAIFQLPNPEENQITYTLTATLSDGTEISATVSVQNVDGLTLNDEGNCPS